MTWKGLIRCKTKPAYKPEAVFTKTEMNNEWKVNFLHDNFVIQQTYSNWSKHFKNSSFDKI